jgi:AraC-like DNA-binding protein
MAFAFRKRFGSSPSSVRKQAKRQQIS